MARGSQNGKSNNPNGRPKGSKNKVDEAVRERFRAFMDAASEEMLDLWRDVAANSPKDALIMIKDYAEFVLPKLSRVESKVENRHVDKDGEDIHTKDKELLKSLGIDL